MVLTHEISATAFIYLNLQPTSGQSRVDPVVHLRTDCVHGREIAGVGPVVLKVIRVTGAAFSRFPMDQLLCASFFHTDYWYVVEMMSDTEGIGDDMYAFSWYVCRRYNFSTSPRKPHNVLVYIHVCIVV